MSQSFLVLFVLLLFLNLPLVDALQISNVRAEEITATSAAILWETDEAANSFVQYGASKETVSSRVGDAALLTEHRLALSNLNSGQAYYYAVESNGLLENNNGEFYSFTTLAADTTAPEIQVTFPTRLAGSQLTLNGSTEALAAVSLLVNETLAAFTSADADGNFLFSNVALQEEVFNSLRLEAKDAAGNTATVAGQVYADTSRPTLELEALPELIEERSFTLRGTISEAVTFAVLVNNESQAQGEGTQLEAQLSLEEGVNAVRIVLTDLAGWETVEELILISDTQAPTVTAELEKGNEYYEGNAETTIHGETEPGATVYLYVYKQRTFQYQPDFEKAWAKVTADAQGKFSFRDIDLEDEPIRLEDLAPRQVPSRLLEEISIQPLPEGQQYWTYSIFLVAEDRTGKTGYWETRVTANTCFSENFDLVLQSQPEFQFPLKLEPRLLDEGRETVQALFSLDYQGQGVPVMRGGEQIAPGYQIQGVRFEPACTQAMLEEEGSGTALGCTALTRREPFAQVSPEQSSVYVQWNLGSLADVSERKADFWEDFTERRRIVFPLKVQITYQDRLGEDQWSAPKVQTSCEELSYFVDIPLESSELIPDFLADEGVSALDFTVRQLDDMRTFLEDVHVIVGISTGASWLLRTVARWMRIASENIEGALSTTCPSPREQAETMYLADTIAEWQDANLPNLPKPLRDALTAGTPEALKAVTLDDNCPTTATFWDLEESINTVFRWAADRAVCRTGDSAVPAGWTEDQKLSDIQRKIAQEQSCGVTGRGIPLQRIENCQEFVDQNPVALPAAVAAEGVSVCWRAPDGILYRYDPNHALNQNTRDTERGLYRLSPIVSLFPELGIPAEPLLVYQPPGSDEYIVGRQDSCSQVCDDPQRPGFTAAIADSEGSGCYPEVLRDGEIRLVDVNREELTTDKYPAGYTNDCFISKDVYETRDIPEGETGLLQCVCASEAGREFGERSSRDGSNMLRTANPGESYIYREDTVYHQHDEEVGTYYPEIRYYEGRDFSQAFGADYVTDYFRSEGEEQVTKVRAESLLGGIQSVCLPSMLSHIVFLENILEGMRNCLIEAKTTEFQDAGMCKTIFTRYVCSLAYEAMDAIVNQCSPNTFDNAGQEGAFGDVGVVFEGVTEGLGDAVSTSIDDFRRDYGNARLNEYFREGAQGFAQSICLAAFGAEFPLLSPDFWQDTAYALPMPTTPVIFPAKREFVSYNPALQTAVHNYEVGAVILPGCRMRNWQMSLACIGSEALGLPGIDPSCDGEGCDCLQRTGTSQLETQREQIIYSGRQLEAKRPFDVPLQSPIRVEDSPFRYDHVKVEFWLDPSERGNEEACFDVEDGYFDGVKGVYYTPINHISTPFELECSANFVTGEYDCPELSAQFGFGGAYLTEPFVTCFNPRANQWMACDTQNLLVLNDEIRARVHLNTDGQGQCLRRTVRGTPGISEVITRTIPENIIGFQLFEDSLATVRDEMFGGVQNVIRSSNPACAPVPLDEQPPATVKGGTFFFQYVAGGLIVSDRVQIETQGYTRDNGGFLLQDSQRVTDLSTINGVVFIIDGFRVNNIASGITNAGDSCTYETSRQSEYAQQRNLATVRVTYDLLERDEAGGCTYAQLPVRTVQGANTKTVTIRLQRDLEAVRAGLHQHFMDGNYDVVQATALNILNQRQGDVLNALAIYYWTASYIMQGTAEDAANRLNFRDQIHNLLLAFFSRQWGGQQAAQYPTEVQEGGEYQRIHAYLCEVAGEYRYPDYADLVERGTCPAEAASAESS